MLHANANRIQCKGLYLEHRLVFVNCLNFVHVANHVPANLLHSTVMIMVKQGGQWWVPIAWLAGLLVVNSLGSPTGSEEFPLQ